MWHHAHAVLYVWPSEDNLQGSVFSLLQVEPRNCSCTCHRAPLPAEPVALKPSCFKTGAVDLGKNTVPTKKEKLECPYRDRIWYAILF